MELVKVADLFGAKSFYLEPVLKCIQYYINSSDKNYISLDFKTINRKYKECKRFTFITKCINYVNGHPHDNNCEGCLSNNGNEIYDSYWFIFEGKIIQEYYDNELSDFKYIPYDTYFNTISKSNENTGEVYINSNEVTICYKERIDNATVRLNILKKIDNTFKSISSCNICAMSDFRIIDDKYILTKTSIYKTEKGSDGRYYTNIVPESDPFHLNLVLVELSTHKIILNEPGYEFAYGHGKNKIFFCLESGIFRLEKKIPKRGKECMICFNELENNKVVIIPCGHASFCECILKSAPDNCPLCNVKINSTVKLFES